MAFVCDNVNGSYSAVEHLIKNGHKSIGIISGPKEVYTSNERLLGYKRALLTITSALTRAYY